MSHQNHYLFSDYYLNEILPDLPEWKDADAHEKCLIEIKAIYQKAAGLLIEPNEAQTEKDFIRPVLEALGHIYDVQPPIKTTSYGTRAPDYAFFQDKPSLQKARKHKGKKEYFSEAMAIGDAKYWNRPLDKKLDISGDPFDNNNPNFQIDFYLRQTEKKWGILTNGVLWRLYNRDTSYLLDNYYQIDLAKLLERADPEAFKYFYLFFRRDAFLSVYAERKSFLDLTYSSSADYAKRVGKELKENVYESLKTLASGFLDMSGNNLNPEKNLEDIRTNSLVLLYRLLFILYAEARNLLPMENPSYRNTYSLDNIKKEIKDKIDHNVTLAPDATLYWGRLKSLFRLINDGSSNLGVPAYNGGLFKPDNHPFLEEHSIGDSFLAKVIDGLSRSQSENGRGRVFVDYRDLEIRDLGTIYEGLLEYRLHQAPEELVITKKNAYVPLREAQEKSSAEIVKKGELYLITDKGERKATGSYYTPEYIVNYIVENTLDPLMDRIESDIKKKRDQLEKKIKSSRGSNRKAYQDELKRLQTSFDDEVLKLKVLDPAMGSGHFLVRATEYLAEQIATNPYAYDEDAPEDETAIDYWKRRVVEHCIYGVDLNPLAVELAKLSLWLKTVARGKPLSFLDHHLRCGNSLIGAKMKDFGVLPELKGSKSKGSKKTSQVEQTEFDTSGFKTDMSLAVKDIMLIEDLPSDNIKDIDKKSEMLAKLDRTRRDKYRRIADLWTSVYFGNEMSTPVYREALNLLQGKGTVMVSRREIESYLVKASALSSEKHFFHWELEFPEVFFNKFGSQLENPGFDVVMGNPPYDVISEKEQLKDVEKDKAYYEATELYAPAIGSKLNFYRLFTVLSLELLGNNGYHSFIVPMALLGDKQARPLRKYLLEQNQIKTVEAFPQKDDPLNRVFLEAKLSTCIYVANKFLPDTFAVRVHPGRNILETSPQIKITNNDIKAFDPENLSIPSYPGVTSEDFKLAVKLNNVAKGARLGFWAPSQQGEVNLTSHEKYLSSTPIGPIVLRGAHIGRYEFHEQPKQGEPAYLNVELFLREHGSDTKAHDYNNIRIGYQRGSAIDNWRRIISTVIEPGNFCTDTINCILNPKQFDLFFVLAILNSHLFEWRFRLTSTNNHVNSYEIDSLPIRRIAFVTPEKEREKQAAHAKGLYQKGFEAFPDVLVFVEERLAKKHKPDPELIKKHNADPINKDWQIPDGTLWEQADVVHDMLAFLAERMIDMNKEKQTEIKGFLEWLERQCKTKIDELKNKTKIRNYYEHSFEELLDTLKDNARNLQVNMTREFEERLKSEFEKSLAKLNPIKEKIEKTDWLIDQIVYKLYGLTEDEIKVVENK